MQRSVLDSTPESKVEMAYACLRKEAAAMNDYERATTHDKEQSLNV